MSVRLITDLDRLVLIKKHYARHLLVTGRAVVATLEPYTLMMATKRFTVYDEERRFLSGSVVGATKSSPRGKQTMRVTGASASPVRCRPPRYNDEDERKFQRGKTAYWRLMSERQALSDELRRRLA